MPLRDARGTGLASLSPWCRVQRNRWCRNEVRVIGKVCMGKTAETEAHTARDEIRKEDVEVDEGVDTDGLCLRDQR
jgi:stress response protein YsnF